MTRTTRGEIPSANREEAGFKGLVYKRGRSAMVVSRSLEPRSTICQRTGDQRARFEVAGRTLGIVRDPTLFQIRKMRQCAVSDSPVVESVGLRNARQNRLVLSYSCH